MGVIKLTNLLLTDITKISKITGLKNKKYFVLRDTESVSLIRLTRPQPPQTSWQPVVICHRHRYRLAFRSSLELRRGCVDLVSLCVQPRPRPNSWLSKCYSENRAPISNLLCLIAKRQHGKRPELIASLQHIFFRWRRTRLSLIQPPAFSQ